MLAPPTLFHDLVTGAALPEQYLGAALVLGCLALAWIYRDDFRGRP